MILIPPGEPVQLAEPARAKVIVDGRPSDKPVEVPAGWWCLPDPGPE